MNTQLHLVTAAALLVSGQAFAAAFTFDTPDFAIPATTGDGLTGQLWINVPGSTDSIAASEAIIAGGNPDANFLSTVVDYPSGATGSASTSLTYGDVLDGVGIGSIDNTAVLTDDVLNTVMRFSGFFKAYANEVWTFSVLSDDGSAVDIQGTRILNNDGIHGFGGPTTTVEFKTDGLYALDILFFESQVSQWGLEFRGGLNGASPTTAISDRLYNLFDYADPDDPRLPVPAPGVLLLVLAGLAGIAGRAHLRG